MSNAGGKDSKTISMWQHSKYSLLLNLFSIPAEKLSNRNYSRALDNHQIFSSAKEKNCASINRLSLTYRIT